MRLKRNGSHVGCQIVVKKTHKLRKLIAELIFPESTDHWYFLALRLQYRVFCADNLVNYLEKMMPDFEIMSKIESEFWAKNGFKGRNFSYLVDSFQWFIDNYEKSPR